MGDLNKKYIINKAETILEKCEEKYSKESLSKKKIRELESENRKLKKFNLMWKIILTFSIIWIAILVF